MPDRSGDSVGAGMFRQMRGVRSTHCGYQRGTVPEGPSNHGRIIVRPHPSGNPVPRRSHEPLRHESRGPRRAHLQWGASHRRRAVHASVPGLLPSPRWHPQCAKRTPRTPPGHEAGATAVMQSCTVMHPARSYSLTGSHPQRIRGFLNRCKSAGGMGWPIHDETHGWRRFAGRSPRYCRSPRSAGGNACIAGPAAGCRTSARS